SLPAVARMRDQVDLGKPWRGYVPTVGLYRNVVLEQSPRLGLPVQALPALALLPRQPPVDLPRADLQQLPLRLRAGLTACESKASRPAGSPSAALTTDTPPLPIPPPATSPPRDGSAASVPAAEHPPASPAAARSEAVSHTSGDNPCSNRIHPTSRPWPCLRLSCSVHKLPGNIPTSLRVPNQPSSFLLLSRVTS